MLKDITYSLYKNSPEMEESLLRGILLFNSKEKQVNREEIRLKALFSIILNGKGQYTDDQILSLYNERFKVPLDKTTLLIMKRKLQEANLLDSKGSPIEVEKGSDFFESIENETDFLFESIIKKVENAIKANIPDKEAMKDNIRNALTIYYKMYGLAFFDLQEMSDQASQEKAIQAAMYNLDKRLGTSLVREIAYTIKNPSEREALILEQWARAFVTMQIIGLDPSLKNFQATRIREKEFILDTDFVLRCLTSEAERSKTYALILKKLRNLKCQIYIPEEVRKEVVEHVNSARSTFSRYGDRLTTYFDEIFKTGIPNVFIEDYVNLRKSSKPDIPFDTYIRQYGKGILMEYMKRVFGSDALSHHIPLEKLNPKEVTLLSSAILPHTESTYLGEKSTDERNREISRVDAILYLVTKMKNEGIAGDTLLSRKTYLVTRTTRSIRAAKECNLFSNNIVCNPDALLSILKETGSDNMADVKFINLFENPFLTYTAREMWDQIGPFVKKQAVFMRYSTIELLRHDVDLCLDEGLTGVPAKQQREIREKVGIFLPEDIESMQSKISDLQKIVKEKDQAIEVHLKEKESLVKKSLKQKKEIDRLNTKYAKSGSSLINSNRSKKRRKK